MIKTMLPLIGVVAMSLVCCLDRVIAHEIVCGNIDIRNKVENFYKLQNCTVVEGYVQIVLIDNGTPKDYENLTFPALKEITDYLLLFRAMGLPSLGKLFPNLSVIRGRNLFHDFALVVYEMLHLQQLGFRNLTDIVRGAVRIEKNPNLCFVETIDWDRIARSAQNGHYIHDNKARGECPVCNSNCSGGHRTPDGTRLIGDQEGRLCWNSQQDSCQRLCDDCEKHNQSCSRTGHCCSTKCMGGCFANGTCVACRHFFHNNECIDRCPPNTFGYLGRRCVTQNECDKISADHYQNATENAKFLKAIDGVCTPDCPPGKIENSNDRRKCDDCPKDKPCPKVCPGTQVTNIASAQSLRGCTRINGSLEIYIQSGGSNVIRELEENLQHLEEISEFLKVARSFPLMTLNFLKRLRLIEGNKLERNQYSFIVLDNPNIQDLWVWDSLPDQKQLTIKRGKIFFHINPKLCYDKIEKLNKYADVVGHPFPWDEHDVSKHTNGDKVACNVNELDVIIWGTRPDLVGLKFYNFKLDMDDQRSLLGYLIYYKEAPHQNVSIFDGRDACSTNSWNVDDYEDTYEANPTDNSNSTDTYITHIIPGLKPFTQYALYIKTYTIASETKGAQSKIIYFKTQQSTPSQPRKLSARAQSPWEIQIEWEEPSRPNGEVTHYLVAGTRDSAESDTFLNERNFCLEPITHDKPRKLTEGPINENNCTQTHSLWKNATKDKKEDSQECCSCTKIPVDDLEVERRISFEDHLINSIYVKKQLNKDDKSSKRRRREISQNKQNNILLQFSTEPETDNTNKTAEPSEGLHFADTVIKNKSVTIKKLLHFTEYTIEVRACQSPNPGLGKPEYCTSLDECKEYCSLRAMTSVRTLPKVGADDIDESKIHWEPDSTENNTDSQGIRIRWSEPLEPNGIIVSYHLEYKKASTDSPWHPVCINRDQYLRNSGYVLQDLSPGNYSYRLLAQSLAGRNTNWTKLLYFTVKDRNSHYPFLIYIVIPVAAVVSISFIILTGVLYMKYKKNQAVLDYVSVNPEYISAGLAYEPDPYWEVLREKVQIGRELGQGSFGMVYEGIYTKDKDTIRCAVKTVNEHASARERIDFLQEADVMKSFVDCHHVVKLLGIVSVGHPVYVLMEIMSNGDLRSYLRSHRPDSEENPNAVPPTLPQLLQMAIEIADGMAYLASRKFVHRDLAARNCMVAEDMTVKIGDFGMTRDIYETDYYRKGGKGLLPVRWMAPESLKDGVFTTYSDVWSYGVVLWEMATLASQPYQGLANEAVLKYVVDGGKMERPENCPQKLWDLMSMCWSRSPKHRPNFIEVIEYLLNDTNDTFLELSYYMKYKSQQKQKSSSQSLHDEPTTPLNQTSETLDREENLLDITDNSKVHFFPLSRTIGIPENSEVRPVSDDENYDIDQIDEYSNADHLLRDVSRQTTNCEERSHDSTGGDNSAKTNTNSNSKTNSNSNSNSNSNTNSKQSTEGSKGSKISSTTSNGSIANGHAMHYKTTSC